MTEQATVNVLTAEVRVLTIGERQLTLSMYRQLDEVSYSQLEPFGRIVDHQDKWSDLSLVGRHKTTDALAKARMHAWESRETWDFIRNAKNRSPLIVLGR